MIRQEYKDFASRVHDKGFHAQALTLGHFELTFNCPLKCAFCYCTPYMKPEFVRRELGTAAVKRILAEAVEAGCLWMTFSGGDPFIRKDFREIYDYARELGMIVTIYCSGLLMSEEWLGHLQAQPPFSIEMPLYGVTAATHEAVSGRKGTFERMLGNLRRMKAAGLPVKVKSKILTVNLHEAEALRRLIEDELGLEFNPNFTVYPRLDRSTDHLPLRLPHAVRLRLEAQYGETGCDANSERQRSGGVGAADPVNPKLFRCASGVNTFYVNPYGELNFCNYLRTASYDLKTGSLLEGVRYLRDELLGLEQPESSSCKSCAIQGSCDNCPAKSYLATGNMHSRDETLCELNQLQRGVL